MTKRLARQKRVRRKIKSTNNMPRLTVFRSSKHIYAQIINDISRLTIVSASDVKTNNKFNKIESAKNVGLTLAKMAIAKKIKKAIFDRGGYKYHGRVRALAEGAREGGLQF